MCSTTSVVVARTDEMTISSGKENKREAVSKSSIDETLLVTWQRHYSSMGIYQRIRRLSKQAASLFSRMSPVRLIQLFGETNVYSNKLPRKVLLPSQQSITQEGLCSDHHFFPCPMAWRSPLSAKALMDS